MNRKQFLGAAVAMAVSGVFATSAAFADKHMEKKPAEKKVKCVGGNSCKGTGACGAADGSHSCAGKNECKGKGWQMVATEDECTKAGGKVEKKKEEKKKA